MIGETLNVGDEVLIMIPDENWQWGYQPVAQQKGMSAKVVGFGESFYSRTGNFGKEPGVYVCYSAVKVKVGKKPEFVIADSFLELKDKFEQIRRENKYRKAGGWGSRVTRLRDLPEMKFWEGDIVKFAGSGPAPWEGVDTYLIAKIEYNYLGQMRNDGQTPMPEYSIEPNAEGRGGTTSVNESELKLVARGNVWKYFNGQKPEFAGLAEEAAFFNTLGHTREVRNPMNGLYSWTKDEILEAIKNGTVDGFSVAGGLFGKGPSLRTVVFKDRELGKRVAAETLKGFGLGA